MAVGKTYGLSDIPNLEQQISGLKSEAGAYQRSLNTSPTALGGSGEPTDFDIENQESLQRINKEIQTLTDGTLRAKWYLPREQGTARTAEGEGTVNRGLMGTALDLAMRPLYAVAGATKHVVGQGEGSLYDDIADNMMRNKSTFGDILTTAGAPRGIAAPLGFALDVAMDPVMWVTMGTGALIPRLASGAYKGATTGEGVLRGLSLAGKSRGLEIATRVGKFTPVLRKSEFMGQLGERALASTEAWEKFSGITMSDLLLQKGAGVGAYRIGLGEVINKVADATPGGRAFLDTLWYDPARWIRQANIKDVLTKKLAPVIDMEEAIKAWQKGDDIAPYMQDISSHIERVVKVFPDQGVKLDMSAADGLLTSKEVDLMFAKMSAGGVDMEKLGRIAPDMVDELDDVYTALFKPGVVVTNDHVENAARIASDFVKGETVTFEEIKKIVQSGALGDSGIRWFDDGMKRAREFKLQIGKNSDKVYKVGEKTLDYYALSMDIFRIAKVA
ncbi:MAG: hypothetical protein NUV96_00500, partial [Candidatus Colwellbacteria bacterium]|nr:hypothetical protein [Candidatus Colwellbacteria bacterium]